MILVNSSLIRVKGFGQSMDKGKQIVYGTINEKAWKHYNYMRAKLKIIYGCTCFQIVIGLGSQLRGTL